ncbi:MAG: hypothetical protein ACLFP1_09645 [Candidatus Goldiibacteriota bacterium]
MDNKAGDFFKPDFSRGFSLKNVVLIAIVLLMIWTAAEVMSSAAAGIDPGQVIAELDREVTENINMLYAAAGNREEKEADAHETGFRPYTLSEEDDEKEKPPVSFFVYHRQTYLFITKRHEHFDFGPYAEVKYDFAEDRLLRMFDGPGRTRVSSREEAENMRAAFMQLKDIIDKAKKNKNNFDF